MPYTPILATLGYVLSPDRRRVLLVHRNARADDAHCPLGSSSKNLSCSARVVGSGSVPRAKFNENSNSGVNVASGTSGINYQLTECIGEIDGKCPNQYQATMYLAPSAPCSSPRRAASSSACARCVSCRYRDSLPEGA